MARKGKSLNKEKWEELMQNLSDEQGGNIVKIPEVDFNALPEKDKYCFTCDLLTQLNVLKEQHKEDLKDITYYKKYYSETLDKHLKCSNDFKKYRIRTKNQLKSIKKRMEFVKNYIDDISDAFIDNPSLKDEEDE